MCKLEAPNENIFFSSDDGTMVFLKKPNKQKNKTHKICKSFYLLHLKHVFLYLHIFK